VSPKRDRPIESRVESDVLGAALAAWSLGPEPRFLRDVESAIFMADLAGREVVLRITETSHRSLAQLKSELDWALHLGAGGVSVAGPIQSLTGEFAVELGPRWSACLFEKAPGELAPWIGQSAPVIRAWGRTLAELHRCTEDYRPSPGVEARPGWDFEPNLASAPLVLPRSEAAAWRALDEMREWLGGLPRERGSYGLVHTDLHAGNFFVSGAPEDPRITVFDLDDACHNWFAYDLAVPLYYDGAEQSAESHARFRRLFVEAYQEVQPLSEFWLGQLDAFVRYRQVLLYVWTFVKEPERAQKPELGRWIDKFRASVQW